MGRRETTTFVIVEKRKWKIAALRPLLARTSGSTNERTYLSITNETCSSRLFCFCEVCATVLVVLHSDSTRSVSTRPFSLLGVMGMAFTALAMTVRWLDGSYEVGGSLVGDVAANLRPAFGSTGGFASVMNPSSLILLCMLSTAYMVSLRRLCNLDRNPFSVWIEEVCMLLF
jgi:hypothetical protein